MLTHHSSDKEKPQSTPLAEESESEDSTRIEIRIAQDGKPASKHTNHTSSFLISAKSLYRHMMIAHYPDSCTQKPSKKLTK